MEAEGNGPSMQGLAQKLEELTERLGGLERENAELRDKVATLEGSAMRGRELATRGDPGAPREGAASLSSGSEETVSRRSLLSKGAAAVVAATAAGTLLSPPRQAKADTFGSVESNSYVYAKTFVEADDGVKGYIANNVRAAVQGINVDDAPGVSGSGGTSGVQGLGDDGVVGRSTRTGFSGVYGTRYNGTDGHGVTGDGKGNAYAGVLGRNDDGIGVWGESKKLGYEGVYGVHTGTGVQGFGVVGDGSGPQGAGVFGRNGAGYGGQFEGGKAQLKLNPKGSVGRPTSGSHQKGEIYLDSAATLFVCTRSGSPGAWRKVTTTIA